MPGVILALLVAVAACSSDDSDAVPTVTPTPRPVATASLGELVSLAPTEAVDIVGEDITVAFHRVADESRCAAGVQCVTAGSAVVVMSLVGPDIDSGQIEFIVRPGGGGITLAGPYTIMLESLEPDPPPQGEVDQGAYRASFTVSR